MRDDYKDYKSIGKMKGDHPPAWELGDWASTNLSQPMFASQSREPASATHQPRSPHLSTPSS